MNILGREQKGEWVHMKTAIVNDGKTAMCMNLEGEKNIHSKRNGGIKI